MNTIFAVEQIAPQSTVSQSAGLVQVETLSTLEVLTGVPAVEWLEYPTESPEQRAARLERIADALLELDDSTARRVAALHREVLAEPAYVETEHYDRVFGPVVTWVLVDEMAAYTDRAAGTAPVAVIRAVAADVHAALVLVGVRAA
ncbi:hypothetical protein [Streptomyces sp. CA-111067]|uniref:hypothetical protein n=1 Tax=Streptomyces sp. CA-111067 TaxID=3240046 RepID=UPI003D978C49